MAISWSAVAGEQPQLGKEAAATASGVRAGSPGPLREELSLSARARKQIYSFSDIGNPRGASPRSVYDPSRQDAIFRDVLVNLQPLKAIDTKLASPREIRVAQNLGSGTVAPISSVGGQPDAEEAAASGGMKGSEQHSWDRGIPREHGELGSLLSWQDVRLELVRNREQVQQQLKRNPSARKMHILSSEPESFGVQPPKNRSVSPAPSRDHIGIRSNGWSFVHASDTALDPYAKMVNRAVADAKEDGAETSAKDRRMTNLQVSAGNHTITPSSSTWTWQQQQQQQQQQSALTSPRGAGGGSSPSPRKIRGDPGFADTTAEERRKADRNFSDLFRDDDATKQLPQTPVKAKGSALDATTWHFLDKGVELEDGSTKRHFRSPLRDAHVNSVDGMVQPQSHSLRRRACDEGLVEEDQRRYAFSWDIRAELERLHTEQRLKRVAGTSSPTAGSAPSTAMPDRSSCGTSRHNLTSSQFHDCIAMEAQPPPAKPRPFGSAGAVPSMTRRSLPSMRQLRAHSPDTARGRKMASMLSSDCFT